MKAGNDALAAKRYDEAAKAFSAASLLAPDDNTIKALAQSAQQMNDALNKPADPESKKRLEELQRAIDLQKQLNQYQAELAARNLDAADRILKQLALTAANDPLVLQAQQQLQNAQAAAAAADAQRQQRLQDFQARVAAGQAAMQAQRYDDAVQAFTYARVLNPDDATVPGLLQQAQNARDLQTALKQFRTALAARDLDAANKAYSSATLLAPNNPAVTQAFSDLQQALAAAQTDAAARDKQTRDFQARLKDGNDAMLARRYDDAVRAFTTAQILNPNDTTVPGLLQQAQ